MSFAYKNRLKMKSIWFFGYWSKPLYTKTTLCVLRACCCVCM